ncbi:hypothetical protein P8886_21385, partial [Bacillus haynesii]|nr:hypothetical protein [Bacillus haynesii]
IFSPSISSGSNFLPSAVLLAEKTPNQNPSFYVSNLCLCTRQSMLSVTNKDTITLIYKQLRADYISLTLYVCFYYQLIRPADA